MHTDGQPKEIQITFTEEDRLNARYFTIGNSCLVATALKRMGYEQVQCWAYHHEVDGFIYYSDQTGLTDLCGMPETRGNPRGPYYRPEIVGKQITLYTDSKRDELARFGL